MTMDTLQLHTNAEKLLTGTVTVTTYDEFIQKLARGTPLKIKLGMDPTTPDLHLGHAVVLSKLKEFQDYGHDIIFLIGDFTARIGDPTGRSKTRPSLSLAAIEENMKTYFEQVSRIIDTQKARIAYNSSWLSPLSLADFITLAHHVTLSRIIERDDFAQRLARHEPISFHELFYPLLQGYDSVVLHADIELGGTDQLFNLLMGRTFQEHAKQEPQIAITLPLLEGLDGKQKMSKSFGNTISLSESAENAFGKLMSLSDQMMWRYQELLLAVSHHERENNHDAVRDGKIHPMAMKKKIAHAIVSRFWSPKEAQHAQSCFEDVHQKKDYSHVPEFFWNSAINTPLWIVDILKIVGISTSSSEIKRLITAGAVSIDGNSITDFKAHVTIAQGMIIRVGKTRFFKIVCS